MRRARQRAARFILLVGHTAVGMEASRRKAIKAQDILEESPRPLGGRVIR